MGYTLFWVKFGHAFAYFVVSMVFHGFTSRNNSKGNHSLVAGLISIFRDGMGPFKIRNEMT